MTNRKALILSVTLVIFFSSLVSKASWDLTSGFVVTIPSAAVDKQFYKLLQNSSQVQVSIPDQTENVGVNVVLSQMTASISYQVGTFNTLASGQSWSVSANNLAVELDIGSISATQTIQEVVGGVNLNLQLNAVCNNVKVTMPAGAATFSSDVALSVQNGQAAVALNQFNISWPQGAWQVGTFTCSGAQGFEQLVVQEITQILSSPQGVQTMLQNYFQNYINQNITQGFAQLFGGLTINTGRTDVVMNLTTQSLAAVSGGYQLQGTLHLTLPLADPGQTLESAAGPLPQSISGGENSSGFLTLPEDVVAQFLAHIHQTGLLNLDFNSTAYPAISGFIHSFWAKLFVFPDLFHFSGEAVFDFQTSVTEAIAFSPDDQGTAAATTLAGTVTGNFLTEVLAPKDNQYVNYIQFAAPTTADLSLDIVAGQIACQPSKTKIKLAATWDPTYVASYHPWKDVNTGSIGGSIQSTLNSKPLTYQLPNLTAGTLTLQATQLTHDPVNKVINIFFDSP